MTRRVGDFRHLAAHKESPFLEHALIELVIGFVRRAHVNVEVVDRRACPLMHKMRELQALHTTDDRAIVVEVAVARADTVNDADTLRRGLAIAQDDVAIGRSRRVGQALELDARKHVRQTPIAVVADLACIEQIVARGEDDVANRHIDEFILLGKINCARRTELLARFARAL